MDRMKRCVSEQSGLIMALLGPAASELAPKLGLGREAVACLAEEAVRGGSAAPLAQLVAALEPALRRATGGGSWQVRGATD
jgi:hypothetical protein